MDIHFASLSVVVGACDTKHVHDIAHPSVWHCTTQSTFLISNMVDYPFKPGTYPQYLAEKQQSRRWYTLRRGSRVGKREASLADAPGEVKTGMIASRLRPMITTDHRLGNRNIFDFLAERQTIPTATKSPAKAETMLVFEANEKRMLHWLRAEHPDALADYARSKVDRKTGAILTVAQYIRGLQEKLEAERKTSEDASEEQETSEVEEEWEGDVSDLVCF